jgi:hypothetical protein
LESSSSAYAGAPTAASTNAAAVPNNPVFKGLFTNPLPLFEKQPSATGAFDHSDANFSGATPSGKEIFGGSQFSCLPVAGQHSRAAGETKLK